MKKVGCIILAIIIVAGAFVGGYFYGSGSMFKNDKYDSEAGYRHHIDQVGYQNTIDTAIPQTDIYNIVNDHFRSPLKEGKTVKKAILVGFDGCRADILAEIQDGSGIIGALTDNGAELKLAYCGGVNYPTVNTQDTSTAPGWCSILTGEWADVHGITANGITKTMDTKTLMTSLTEDGIIGSASFITKWAGHFDRKNATYLAEMEYCEKNNLKVDFVKCKDDAETIDYTYQELNKPDCADFLFTILEHTDSTGHGKGFSFNNPEYKLAFNEMNLSAERFLESIRSRETFDQEDWLIIVTSDHGGINTDHGGESLQERMTFVVVDYLG